MAEFRLPALNRVFIAGNLTRDPELRYTASGVPVANFRIASNRWYRSPDGERREDVCYVNIVAWQRLAELVGERLRKGSAVLIEGEMQSRQWETEGGARRTVVEIRAFRVQFLNRMDESRTDQSHGSEGLDEEESIVQVDDLVDDLPF
ncbi:single-stranded DNA-binding protein [Candidatus Fermentibacteria bacterium]|nr:single-stranded DNA-binding protein [Candidatus Fermentibacteria bacterium]